jgi:hypothetical protein
MANPRKITGPKDGVGFRALSFLCDGTTIAYSDTASLGSAVAGRAVGLVVGTSDTVELVADGQTVLGRLDHVEADGVCAVQVEGEAKLPQATAGAVARGGKIIGGLLVAARGYIKAPTADVAGALAARHEVLDNATSTAISVMLGD